MKINRKYKSPIVKAIQIDKQISLSLESPPCGPGECSNQLPNNAVNNPYKSMG